MPLKGMWKPYKRKTISHTNFMKLLGHFAIKIPRKKANNKVLLSYRGHALQILEENVEK